jgi:hypothetical protein
MCQKNRHILNTLSLFELKILILYYIETVNGHPYFATNMLSDYSFLRLSAGLIDAVLFTMKPIVSRVRDSVMINGIIKFQTEISIFTSKELSHSVSQ